MAIPTALGLFQTIATILGAASFFLLLREYNAATDWNKCAPTLSVNQCPEQDPKTSFECRAARRGMDSFIRSQVQLIRREDIHQYYVVVVVGVIVIISVLSMISYIFIPHNGQLCLAKFINLSLIGVHGLVNYWGVITTLTYNQKKTSGSEEPVCNLESTVPSKDFGDPLLNGCFGDFHICQNAILQFVALGLSAIAAVFHFLGFFAAFWDCQTHIDVSDWGTVENLPENSIIHRSEPPRYDTEDEKTKYFRAQYEKKQEKILQNKIKEVERKRQKLAEAVNKQESLRLKEAAVKLRAREKQQRQEEKIRMKEEKDHLELEKKRIKLERNKREEEVEKQLGGD